MRRLGFLALAPLLAAASPVQAPAPATSYLRALLAFQAAKSDDRFADAPSIPAAEGEQFRVEGPFLDGERRGAGTNGSTMWVYEEGELTLSVIPDYVGLAFGSRTKGKAIFYKVESVAGASYVGENAFGTRRQVTSSRRRQYGLFVTAQPVGEFSQYETEKDLAWYRANSTPAQMEGMKTDYVLRLPVGGAEARRLSQQARVRLEGTLVRHNGRMADCETRSYPAKVDSPIDEVEDSCFLFARIEAVTFIDSGSGAVLKRWPPQE